MAALDVTQYYTMPIVGISVGAVMLLLAITGGGEWKDHFKIGPISNVWRIVAGVVSVVFFFLGFTSMLSSNGASSKPSDHGSTVEPGPSPAPIPPKPIKPVEKKIPANSPRTSCFIDLTALQRRADHATPSTWKSFNDDVMGLAGAGISLEDYLTNSRPISEPVAKDCLQRLRVLARNIIDNACDGKGIVGVPATDDHINDHCIKSKALFFDRLDKLQEQLDASNYNLAGASLTEKGDTGFSRWQGENFITPRQTPTPQPAQHP